MSNARAEQAQLFRIGSSKAKTHSSSARQWPWKEAAVHCSAPITMEMPWLCHMQVSQGHN